MFLTLTLSGCGGGSSSGSGPTINTYVAGAGPFGNAIDSAGNIWVANGGNGIPGTAERDNNVHLEKCFSGNYSNECFTCSRRFYLWK
ncbi:MAG: hypothetical protein ACYCSQ_02185 [bacterium]